MRNKTNHNHQLGNYLRYLGYIANMGLGIIALAFLFPFVTSTSSAVEFIDLPATSTFSSTISLSLGQPADIDLTPAASGSFGSTNAKLVVSTSSNAGYQLYINTLDQTSAMTNVYNNANSSITALTQPTVAGKFEANTWGYSISATKPDQNTTYYRVPTDSTIATETTAGGNSDELYLSFAANIDTTLPAGTYANTVAISAIANPAKITNLSELTYMQDMTSSICTNTKGANNSHQQDATGSYVITPGNEVEKRLIDSRDGKEYWVAKLADGNCWMTQNLAYDLVKGKVLTPSDTDVTSDWVVPVGTFYSVNNPIPANKDTEGSYNLGEYVFVTPRTAKLCKTQNANVSQYIPENNASFPYVSLSGDETLDVCENFQNVTDWRPTFVAQPGAWQGEKVDVVAAKLDENGKSGEYDAHYLAGNYYQFNALAAGTADSTVLSPEAAWNDANKLVDAKSSICPKGWKLPVAGGNTKTGQPFVRQDSFVSLFAAYGYPTDNYTPSSISGYTPFLNGENQNPELAPFYYPRSGVVFASYGVMIYTGMIGSASSSTIAPGAYKFAFTMQIGSLSNADVLHTSGDSSRFMAKNVRCMAR